MADIISLNKAVSDDVKKSLEEIKQFKEKGLAEVTKQIQQQETVGYLILTFDAEGNTTITAAGQLDPADCCMALERVKYQIVTNDGGM